MTANQVEKYITEDLGMTPRHNCEALACAKKIQAGSVVYTEKAIKLVTG